jgi:hypothetical protein
MPDRILIGDNPNTGNVGFWITKPGANVMHLAGNTYLDSVGQWYTYNEEFDWLGSDSWSTIDDDSDWRTASGNYIRRSANNTLLFSAGTDDPYIDYQLNTYKKTFIGSEYPIVEVRLRLVPSLDDVNLPDETQAVVSPNEMGDFVLFFDNKSLSRTGQISQPFNLQTPERHGVRSWTSPSANQIFNDSDYAGTGYKSIFTDNEYRVIQWDMSNCDAWMDPYKYIKDIEAAAGVDNPHDYSTRYRISYLALQFNKFGWEGGGGNSTEPPMWEIDYIRVKKKDIPKESGPYNSLRDCFIFSSDWDHSGLVHQSGTVTIGTQKAKMDGTTSDKLFSDTTRTDANGIVHFPKLPYIPLVLFQRFDPNGFNSYPGGEKEFSIARTQWEDPTYPLSRAAQDLKAIDPLAVLMGLSQQLSNFTYESGRDTAFTGADFLITGDAQTLLEALITPETDWGSPSSEFFNYGEAGLAQATSSTSDGQQPNADGTPGQAPATFPDGHPLPWKTNIPSQSMRSGNNFANQVSSFYEARTFAYVRAAKDRFYLTCRNAIANEGMEPVLNLAPMFPEEGNVNAGSAAISSENMNFGTGHGNWGMFHPAFTLYDDGPGPPVPFSEGLKLTWNTVTSANTDFMDKVGKKERTYNNSGDLYPRPDPGDAGTTTVTEEYEQYKWIPAFSSHPLVFNGDLARPTGDLPTSESDFPKYNIPNGLYSGNTGGFYPYRYHKEETYGIGSVGSQNLLGTRYYYNEYQAKRLSGGGVEHPSGVVPETDDAFDNRHGAKGVAGRILNQTAYIGGAKNTKVISGGGDHTASFDASQTNPPVYKYWVLRIPVSIEAYTPTEG